MDTRREVHGAAFLGSVSPERRKLQKSLISESVRWEKMIYLDGLY